MGTAKSSVGHAQLFRSGIHQFHKGLRATGHRDSQGVRTVIGGLDH